MTRFMFEDSRHFYQNRVDSTFTILSEHLIRYKPTSTRYVANVIATNKTLIQALATLCYTALFSQYQIWVIKSYQAPDIQRFFSNIPPQSDLFFFAGKDCDYILGVLKETIKCSDLPLLKLEIPGNGVHDVYRAVW